MSVSSAPREARFFVVADVSSVVRARRMRNWKARRRRLMSTVAIYGVQADSWWSSANTHRRFYVFFLSRSVHVNSFSQLTLSAPAPKSTVLRQCRARTSRISTCVRLNSAAPRGSKGACGSFLRVWSFLRMSIRFKSGRWVSKMTTKIDPCALQN